MFDIPDIRDLIYKIAIVFGITHFKLSTTFSEICSIQYEQKKLKSKWIIYYFLVKFVL